MSIRAAYCLASCLTVINPVVAGETAVYRCDKEGKVIYNNTPFEAGECSNVTESVVDSEVNLLSAGDQPAATAAADPGTTGKIEAVVPNPITQPDIEAGTAATEAADAANLSADSAGASAEAAARLAAKPYDPSLENTAEASAGVARPYADAAKDAAFEAAGVAKSATTPDVINNTNRAARGTNTAAREATKAADATELAVRLSRENATQKEIQQAADAAAEAAEASAEGADVATNAAQGATLPGAGLARAAGTAPDANALATPVSGVAPTGAVGTAGTTAPVGFGP